MYKISQRGSTFVEMMLILPLFVMVLLFFIFSYDLVNEQLEKQVEVSANLREGLWNNEPGCYAQVKATATGGSVMPDVVWRFFNLKRYYRVEAELQSHGGPCQGLGRNKYRMSHYRRY